MRSTDCLPLAHTQQGTRPATHAGALTGDRTFCFAGRQPTHWATPARAGVFTYKFDLGDFSKMYFQSSILNGYLNVCGIIPDWKYYCSKLKWKFYKSCKSMKLFLNKKVRSFLAYAELEFITLFVYVISVLNSWCISGWFVCLFIHTSIHWKNIYWEPVTCPVLC